MTKEALKLALEALEDIGDEWGFTSQRTVPKRKEAITAIKKALAQPEQEPVVWMYQDKSTHEVRFQKHMRDFVDHGQTYETPLYTTPPQRTWVGLTDEEIDELSRSMVKGDKSVNWLCRAIEAKLKEKNT